MIENVKFVSNLSLNSGFSGAVVAKNCSRFVLMVWLLLAFVLMQSYTANLTSILTLDTIQPSLLSVDDLRGGNHYVGYQADSFVYDLLVNQLKLNPLKLKPYSNISDYHQALKNGSQGEGVSAIFDEVPYLEVFLQKFSSNYIMAGPTYRTDGFGFVSASQLHACMSCLVNLRNQYINRNAIWTNYWRQK